MNPTYKCWLRMRQRCVNPANKSFENYGGRGISVDPRWDSYANFRADMGSKPRDKSLDRIDNSKGYSKENCRWATSAEQNNNRRERKLGYKILGNTSGLSGVSYCEARKRYEAYGNRNGVRAKLYWGFDFFEACCRRKSWEASRV